MRGLLIGEHGLEFRDDLPEPVPRTGEVPVRVRLAGLCETDQQLVAGYMGFRGIPGHEFVGEALAGPFEGQRVVGEINCGCSHCDWCRRGQRTHCPNRTVIGIYQHDGAFAETVCVPVENLHRVPDHVSDEAATFVEPLAAAMRIREQLAIGSGDTVLVLGDGRLGSLCAHVLAEAGALVTVRGKHDSKLARIQTLSERTLRVENVAQAIDTPRFDVVVDCTGSPTGLASALANVRPLGTVVFKTTVWQPHQLDLSSMVIHEIRVQGSRCGPFAPAVAALAAGHYHVERLIDQVVPLAEGPEIFRAAQHGPTLKVLFRP